MSMPGFKNSSKYFLVLVFLLGFSASVHAKSYNSVLRKWTKHKQWFNTETLQVDMLWHATYFSPEFRRAYEEKHIKIKYLDPVAAARFIADQEKQQTEGDEFFIGLYTSKPYKEFSTGPESFWEAVLVTQDGQEFKAARVDMVPITPYEKILFPYLNRWSKGYRVVFPKVPSAKKFELIMRSVLGETHLKWK